MLARVISLGLGARPPMQPVKVHRLLLESRLVREDSVITTSRLLRGMGVGYGRVLFTLFIKDFKQDEIFQVCMVNINTFLVCEVTM